MRGLINYPGELFWGVLLTVVGGLLLLEALGVFAIGELLGRNSTSRVTHRFARRKS